MSNVVEPTPAVVFCNAFSKTSQGSAIQNYPVCLLPLKRSTTDSVCQDDYELQIVLQEILNFLINNRVRKILLFCTCLGELIEKYVKEHLKENNGLSDGGMMSNVEIRVHTSSSQHCVSEADALREIYRTPTLTSWIFSSFGSGSKKGKKPAEALNLSDFLLIRGDSLMNGYSGLQEDIKKHQIQKKKTPQLLFSMLATSRKPESVQSHEQQGSRPISIFDGDMIRSESVALQTFEHDYLLGWFSWQKLLGGRLHQENSFESPLGLKSLEITTSKMRQVAAKGRNLCGETSESPVRMRSGIMETGISICSFELLAVMKENFDFMNLNDCINTYVLVNDESCTNEAYENDEVSRAINQYDIRLPIITVNSSVRSPPVSSYVIRTMDSYQRLLDSEQHHVMHTSGPFKSIPHFSKELMRHFLTKYRESCESTLGARAVSSFSETEKLEDQNINSEDFWAIFLHQIGKANEKVTKDDFFERILEDYERHIEGKASKQVNYHSESAEKEKISSEESSRKKESLQFLEEITEVVRSSILHTYFESRDPVTDGTSEIDDEDWGEISTLIDSNTTVRTKLVVDPNNLQVSLSQIRFTYNQSPADFGRAFLLAIVRLVFRETKEQPVFRASESKEGKKTQKLFQNYTAIFSRFLAEERFGGGDTINSCEIGSTDKIGRILLFLIEISQHPSSRARMPYFLKAIYEESVISEDEILSTDDYLKKKPSLEEVYKIIEKYGVFPLEAITNDIFDTWDHCEPFLEALYDEDE